MSAQPQDRSIAGADRTQFYFDLTDDYPEVVYLALLSAFREDITSSLIRMRKDAGLSREDLGNMLGLDPDMARMLEEGGRFSIKQVFAWAWACGKIPARIHFLDRNETLTRVQGVPVVDGLNPVYTVNDRIVYYNGWVFVRAIVAEVRETTYVVELLEGPGSNRAPFTEIPHTATIFPEDDYIFSVAVDGINEIEDEDARNILMDWLLEKVRRTYSY